jgi:hypothetical protein
MFTGRISGKIAGAIAGTLLLAGCAAQQPTISPLLGEKSAPAANRSCGLSSQPVRLPAASQLIDSTGVQRFLAEHVDARGYLVLSIGYDTLGVAESELPVVETDLEEATVESIVAAVSGGAQQRSPFPAAPGPNQARDNSWSVLLRIDLGEPATMRIGRMERCRPELLNRSELNAVITREYGALLRRTPGLPESMQIIMHIYVDSTGMPVRVQADRSSGRYEVDALAHSAAMQARFIPAYFNRKPVTVVVSIPINLKVHKEPRKEEDWPGSMRSH